MRTADSIEHLRISNMNSSLPLWAACLSHRRNTCTQVIRNCDQISFNQLKKTSPFAGPFASCREIKTAPREEEAGVYGWRQDGSNWGRDEICRWSIWHTKVNDIKAEVMGKWPRFACLGVNLDEGYSPHSWMCWDYSAEKKRLLPRAVTSSQSW